MTLIEEVAEEARALGDEWLAEAPRDLAGVLPPAGRFPAADQFEDIMSEEARALGEARRRQLLAEAWDGLDSRLLEEIAAEAQVMIQDWFDAAPRAQLGELQVEERRGGVERIDEIAGEWRALCDEGPADQPFHRPEWIAAHVRAFERGKALCLLTARADGRLRAVLPLIEERVSLYGVLPVRRLRSAAGVHSCRFDIVQGAGDGERAVAALWSHLARRPGWDLLELRDVPPGGGGEVLATAAAAAGFSTGRQELLHSPFIPIPAEGARAVLASRDPKFRANLRRRQKRLEERGPVALKRIQLADSAALAVFYELENAGWKGDCGTAILCSAAERQFYDEIARTAGRLGYLSLYVLTCGGSPVAMHFALTHRGRYLLLKPAYDEAQHDCSPGQLLVARVLEDLDRRGIDEFDFLGPAMDWKADWTDERRAHSFHIVFRRGLRGRVLRAVKFELAPRLKAMTSSRSRPGEDGPPRSRDPVARGRRRLVATALPSLRPGMLLPRAARVDLPFPFDDAAARFTYFARNGIFHLARSVLDLVGREVLFPAYFHGAELDALLAAGVRPRFYPVHERMRVDAAEIAARIGPRTRAIYLIHYLGFPGPVEELRRICDERGLLLIEDCAQSLFSALGDRPLGSFGDAAVFCLYKTLPTPNGGVVVTRRGDARALDAGAPPPWTSTLAHSASSLLAGLEVRGGVAGRLIRGAVRTVGNAAARVVAAERVPTGTQHFDVGRADLGMSRLSRRVIEAQDFRRIVELRRRNYLHLLGELQDLHAPVHIELRAGLCPLFFPFPTADKRRLLRELEARGVECVDFWRLPHPAVPAGAFPAADELRRTVLEIPCHQDLSPWAIGRVAAIVHEVVGARRS